MSYKITEECISCGMCAEECPIDAIEETEDTYAIDQKYCAECGACMYVCDEGAILNQ